jgi:hypothetical protein
MERAGAVMFRAPRQRREALMAQIESLANGSAILTRSPS